MVESNDRVLTAVRQNNQFVMELFQSYVNVAIGTLAARLLAKDIVWTSPSHWLKVLVLLFVASLTIAQAAFLKNVFETWAAPAIRRLFPKTTHDKLWAKILMWIATTLVYMSAWMTVTAAGVFLGNAAP
jgi:hypothetical protein